MRAKKKTVLWTGRETQKGQLPLIDRADRPLIDEQEATNGQLGHAVLLLLFDEKSATDGASCEGKPGPAGPILGLGRLAVTLLPSLPRASPASYSPSAPLPPS